MPFPLWGPSLPQCRVRAKIEAAALLPTAFSFWAGRPVLAEPSCTHLVSSALPAKLILPWSLPDISPSQISPFWVEELQGCQILQYSGYFLKLQLLKQGENWWLPPSDDFCLFKEFLILWLVQQKQGPGACSSCQEAEAGHTGKVDLGCAAVSVATLCPGTPRPAGQPSKIPLEVAQHLSPILRHQAQEKCLRESWRWAGMGLGQGIEHPALQCGGPHPPASQQC